ncbi:DUF2089 domain-containing protein [Oscillospiraceae bacterium MB08-C2-2]|nr:DUF2089 domain-containing protein [Oscillospiraceae bacterium MB08-C2-2]
MPKNCPACSHNMQVRVLKCPACQTEVQGNFALDRFSLLQDEHRIFLETFIRCRGSLKDVCTEMGISYPTARNRLDALIGALGFEERESATAYRLEILGQLKAGQITTEEALTLLQGGNGNG